IFTSGKNGVGEMGMVTSASLENWLAEVAKHQQKVGNNTCPNFGYPIRDKLTYNYGRYQHIAWEFSNGFKAFSPDLRRGGFTPLFSNYDIIIDKSEASRAFKDQNLLPSGKELKFSPYIGTYSVYQGGLKTAYLTPKASGGGTTPDYQVVTVENELLSRADTEISSLLQTRLDLDSGKDNLFTTYYKNGLGSTFCTTKYLSDRNCRKLISLLGFPIESLTTPIRVSSFNGEISTVNQDMQRQHHIGGTSFIHMSTRDFGGGSVTPISTVYRHSLAGIRDLYFDQGGLSLSHPLRFPFGDTTIAAPGVIRQNFASNQAVLFTISSNNARITEADALRKSGYSCDIQPVVDDFTVLTAYVNGVTDTGVSELEGAFDLIIDPIGTVQGIYSLITNFIPAIEGVSQALIDQYNSASCQGRRSYLAGQITALAGSAVIGAKGASKVTAAIKATRAGIWIERIAQIKKTITAGLKTRIADYANLLTRKTASFWEELYSKRLENKIVSIDLKNQLDDYKVYQLALETEEEILKEVLKETGETSAKVFRNISFTDLYNEAGALLAQAKSKGLKIFQIVDTSGNQRLTDYLARRAVESGKDIYTSSLSELKSDSGRLRAFLTDLHQNKMNARKKFLEAQNYNVNIGIVDSKAKEVESLLLKMESEPDKFFNLGQVKDLERHRIVVNEMKDMEKVYDKMEEIYGGNILEIKPKYQKGIEFDGNPNFEAKQYRVNESIQMVIKDENGDIFEIQIKTKRSHDAGEFEHLEVYKKPETTENLKEVGSVKAYMDAYIKDLRNYVLSN
ncbi:MAG: hypothetical protein KDI30_12540, partial [Pseudomonadales bacterium]|nr:hypothetical protein [Pseudomonadales bacterium]